VTSWQLVTGGSPMTQGRHYWEVGLTKGFSSMIGAVRPGLGHGEGHANINDVYFIFAGNGSPSSQGGFAEGDRVGMLLDLDAGWMRYYRTLPQR
jgi:hypothetical protein